MFDKRILADRSILVTGGGSGLGLAMAKKFAAHGAKVTIAGRTLDRLERAAREIAEVAREGGEVDVFPADVREPDEVDNLVQHVVTRFGRVDSLVNNAAGNFLVTSEDLTPNGFDAVVKTVLHGSVFCTLAVGRHLLARQAPGSVVSVVLWTTVTVGLAAFFRWSSSFGDTYGPLAGFIGVAIDGRFHGERVAAAVARARGVAPARP